jgi:D-alanyl-D-alanine carboxypeptidase
MRRRGSIFLFAALAVAGPTAGTLVPGGGASSKAPRATAHSTATTRVTSKDATGPATPTVARLPARLDQLLKNFARDHPSLPGVALAIRTPTLSWADAAGFADRASGKPLTADAGFRIASVTKAFTAAAILRLVENGKLALNDPIAQHLSPATLALLRHGGYKVNGIRIKHLLQHTSGLYDYAGDPAFQTFVVSHPRHRWTRSEQVRFAMNHGKPLAQPGAEFHYSDTGYVLLGEILERGTGHNLAAAYRTLLHLNRLGLANTYLETLEPMPPHAKQRAHQYLGTIDTAGFDPSFDLYGGGGLVSTVGDLDRFFRALLGGHVFAKAATLDTMLGNPRLPGARGLGMGIFEESIGQTACWHDDGFWGTTVFHCPGSGATIAITVNQATEVDAAIHQLDAAVLRLVNRT